MSESSPDYMGDLCSFLPPDPPTHSKPKPKSKPSQTPNSNPKPANSSRLDWRDRRRVERERRQVEEDKLTAAALATAAIPASNIGFKLLAKMGYDEGLSKAEPVAPEIKRGRAGLGAEDPVVLRVRKEKERGEKKRKRVEEIEREFGEKQRSQWRTRRVVADFRKAEAALAQLEKREVLPEPEKKEDNEENDEEEEEEVITEEDLLDILTKLRNEHCYCLYCGCQYESMEALETHCPGLTEDDH